MAFAVYGVSENSTTKSKVDYDALNKYVVETAGVEDVTVIAGVVSGIVDLGTQQQEDASVVFTGTEEDEQSEIEKNPGTYFEDGPDPQNSRKTVRLKRWPQRAVQCVAVAVDFPDIMVDKSQFFEEGEPNPKPLRLYLGGRFYVSDVGMIVGRPTPLKWKKNTKNKWSFDKKHLFYKMAAAAKLVKAVEDEAFTPNDIDKLIGKVFNFEVQVFFRENKGKKYYTENIKFQGALSKGQPEPDVSLVETFQIQFYGDNKIEHVKELRNHVKNTIKRAANYEDSKIKQQIESLGGSAQEPADEDESDDVDNTPIPAPVKAVVKPAKSKDVPVVDPEDEDSPF